MRKGKQLTNKAAKRKAFFWLKGKNASVDDSRTDLEIVVDDYIRCIKYLLNGKIVPITGFRDGVNEWLMTANDGDVDLDSIPHDNCEMTECRYEIEALIGDNGYDEDTVLKALNEKILALS